MPVIKYTGLTRILYLNNNFIIIEITIYTNPVLFKNKVQYCHLIDYISSYSWLRVNNNTKE